MPALQVRDLPADLYEKLRISAQREHRSIAQQTIFVLEDYLTHQDNCGEADQYLKEDCARSDFGRSNRDQEDDEGKRRIEKRKEVFARLDALPRFEVPDDFPSAAQIIREIRDER